MPQEIEEEFENWNTDFRKLLRTGKIDIRMQKF
jgi:hypothetical protein